MRGNAIQSSDLWLLQRKEVLPGIEDLTAVLDYSSTSTKIIYKHYINILNVKIVIANVPRRVELLYYMLKLVPGSL